MRTRRTHRIDLDEADRLVAGDRSGPGHPGLGNLLDALRAPTSPEELAGEKATVAAFTAHRKRVARDARKKPRPTRTRAITIPVAVVLALLAFGGTALAARSGTLPVSAQQRAHRLFSALGVPAPRTGPAGSSPAPVPSLVAAALVWCDDWRASPSGTALDDEDRQKLIAAAGSEQRVADYCDDLRGSASPSPSPSAGASSGAPSEPSGSPSVSCSAAESCGPSPSVSVPSSSPRTRSVSPTPSAPTTPTPGPGG
jgi:hypothetical protein